MNLYNIWCNLRPGVSDLEFVDGVNAYLGNLEAQGLLSGYRIMRCKLGLCQADLPEFHLMLEFDSLDQLDRAFHDVARRADPIESLHHAVNSRACDVRFALYRDFPDSVRERGQERF